ncbi:hypothetical protein FB107DRAFT_294922 [Schizophyllum commune]
MLDHSTVLNILNILDSREASLYDLLRWISVNHTMVSDRPVVHALFSRVPDILSLFSSHRSSRAAVRTWSLQHVIDLFQESLAQLTDIEHGWHFKATSASKDQIMSVQLEDMARSISQDAPELWRFLGALLRGRKRCEEADEDGDVVMTGPSAATQRRREYTASMKQLVCTSILMHGTNQKCNAFQSIIGIYLKSCNTPERVVDCLHRMGLSISQDSIYNAVNSLSSEATENLREMGQSLTVGYTYDNMDINFALATSSIDNLGDTLAHMTAGFVFHLDHGATPEMFACSDQLYEHSPYNPRHLIQDRPQYSFSFISQLHREDPTAAPHPSGLSRRDRFNRWKFLYTLVHDGPEYFHQFRSVLKGPELIDPIPLVKLRSAPLRMMDKSEASVSGNIDVISDILRQAGLGDVHDVANTRAQAHLVDITRYVLLFHGDLGTYERVMSVIEHRSLESTPFRRFQFIVFIFGLFHLKMAAADAIWRIFLRNKCGKGDPNSVLHLVSLMRPHDSNKIGSNPRFRQMHEVIMHVGAVLRLDAWREAAGSRAPYSSLDEFAASKPSLDDLEAAASLLVLSHVPRGCDTYDARHKPSAARDGVFENTALIHRYFLLYEELSDAMNTGDIGRVEVVFAPWVLLFKATGKHKYANAMIKSLSILHADYFPSDLR